MADEQDKALASAFAEHERLAVESPRHETLDQNDYDNLYHMLRRFSNGSPETRRAAYCIASHLLRAPDYEHLLTWSTRYGMMFLQMHVKEVLQKAWPDRSFPKVIELGAGFGWLGMTVAQHYGVDALLVDNRAHLQGNPLGLYSYELVDLENGERREKFTDKIWTGDMIVMCDFLHCVDDPAAVLKSFSGCPMLIMELTFPETDAYRESFKKQIERYGATAFKPSDVWAIVDDAGCKIIWSEDHWPYTFICAHGGVDRSES